MTTEQQIKEALADVTARRIERFCIPGVFRVFRNEHDEVVVEVFDN